MPYAVPNGGILEVSIKGKFELQTFLSVFHYRITAAGGTADGDAAINAADAILNVAGGFVDAYADALHADAILEDVIYQWIHPKRYHRVRKAPVTLTGHVAGTKMPPNVSGPITKKSVTATRHSRGTLHMPAVPASFVIGGTISNAGQIAYNNFALLVVSTGALLGYEPVLFNRLSPGLSEAIVEAYSETTSRVQRRRTVGLGI